MRDVVFNIWDPAETVIGIASNQFGDGHFILSAIHDEGTRTLTMMLDATDEKAELFATGNFIGFYDMDGYYQMFEIAEADTTAGDASTLEISAEHVRYELAYEPIYDVRPTNTSVGLAIEQALAGTRWGLSYAVDAGANSVRGYYTDVLSYLSKIAETWGVELEYDLTISRNQVTARSVRALVRRGAYRGRRFEYSKDTQSIKGHLSTAKIRTALIGRGRGEEVGSTESGDPTYGRRIGIDEVEWRRAWGDPTDKPLGQRYVEDAEAKAQFGIAGGTKNRIGIVTFDSIDDPTELLLATWERLQELKRPEASYSLTVMDLERSEGPHEAVRLGDTVLVIHRAIKPPIVLEARVSKIMRDLLSPENTKLELGDARSFISDRLADIARVTEKTQGINDNGTFPTDHLQGAIDALRNQLIASGGYDHAEVLQNKGILLENTNEQSEAYGALYLGPGIFAIADTKDGGDWNWRTFGTGRGFTGDEIVAGTIRASLVKILGTDRFFWDANSIYINTDPEDLNKQIRIGCYDGVRHGIAFTSDGGQTWNQIIDEAGYVADLTGYVTGADFQTFQQTVTHELSANQIVNKVRSSSLYQYDKQFERNFVLGTGQPLWFIDGYLIKEGVTASISFLNYALSSDLWSASGGGAVLRVSLDMKRTSIAGVGSEVRYAGVWIYYTYLDGQNTVSAGRGWYFRTTDTTFSSTDPDWVRLNMGVLNLTQYSAIRIDYAAIAAYPGWATGQVEMRNLKVEVGDAYTSWRPAVEDLSNIPERVSSAEQKITADAIVSTVRSSAAYQGDLDSKVNESAFEQNAQSITATFRRIGLDGGQSGITKADIDGIQVSHTSISTVSRMMADGFKIYRIVGGNQILIGGVYVPPGGSEAMMCASAITDPTVSANSRIVVGMAYTLADGIPFYGLRFINGSVTGGYIGSTGPTLVLKGSDDIYFETTNQHLSLNAIVRYRDASSPMKIRHGTGSINGTTNTYINYSDAGFTAPPCVTVTYSTTDPNWSGDNGCLKVYSKTAYGAYVIVGGNFPTIRTIDWIAIGV